MPDIDKTLLMKALGDSLERMMLHAIPIEQWPRKYWFTCPHCMDKGIELAWPEKDPHLPYHVPEARACIHCPAGKYILKLWSQGPTLSKSEIDRRKKANLHMTRTEEFGGPYFGYTSEDMRRLLQHECAHSTKVPA